MNSKFSPDVINIFKSQFESKCIYLLLSAYEILKAEKEIIEKNENSITAQLIGIMKKNPDRMKYQISITREAYLDSDDIYKGLINADKSPRIDMKYITWNSEIEYEFHMEAKNLCEMDWKRKNDNVTIKSQSLTKRYIDIGIHNFATGKYSSGILIGFILQGNPDKVAEGINKILTNKSREVERLLKVSKNNHKYVYESTLPKFQNKKLLHYFLVFGLN